jgi:hypothetical protein
MLLFNWFPKPKRYINEQISSLALFSYYFLGSFNLQLPLCPSSKETIGIFKRFLTTQNE